MDPQDRQALNIMLKLALHNPACQFIELMYVADKIADSNFYIENKDNPISLKDLTVEEQELFITRWKITLIKNGYIVDYGAYRNYLDAIEDQYTKRLLLLVLDSLEK